MGYVRQGETLFRDFAEHGHMLSHHLLQTVAQDRRRADGKRADCLALADSLDHVTQELACAEGARRPGKGDLPFSYVVIIYSFCFINCRQYNQRKTIEG